MKINYIHSRPINFYHPAILFFIILTTYSDCLAKWSLISPIPMGHDLKKVYFIDSVIGWAVGNYGTIIHSSNGGLHWTRQNSGTFDHLNGTIFVNESIGWCAGTNGTILYTNDGGLSWIRQKSNTKLSLSSIHFQNENIGFAVGDSGLILKTNNGGQSWKRLQTITSLNLNDVFSYEDSICIVVSNGSILRSKDAGETWELSQPYGINLNRLFFLDPLNGWIVGIDGIIINTNDGGATWNKLKAFTSLNLYSVFFHDSLNGCISANNSTCFFTSDGGKSWAERRLTQKNERFNLFSLYFTDKFNGILVSDYGHIFITSDMGENWADATERLFSYDVLGVHFNNDNEGWLAGGGGHVFYTSDGGSNWIEQQTGTTEHLCSIQFIDSNYGWAVGFGGTFLKTTNGGKNWVLNKLSKDEFLKVFFLDSLNGWIAGSTGYIGPYAPQGIIFKTTDGGKTWKSWNFYSSFPGNGMGFSDAFFTTKDTGWVISVNEIYSTVDGGENWNKDVKSREYYYSISFADNCTGWIVGRMTDENEGIKKTTDGGKTWIIKRGQKNKCFLDVHFIDLNNGWIFDNDGMIFFTSDGGENWIEDESIRDQRISLINFSSLKHGIAAGKAGLIMRFDNQIDGISGDFPVNAKETLYFLYPTQTSDIIQIKTRKNDARNLPQISIINILGNIILSTEFRDRIDVGFLSQGVYFVRIGDELMKFIKL